MLEEEINTEGLKLETDLVSSVAFPPHFFWIFKMELLPLSLFIVFDHRHLGHKQQVNKIKQQVIIIDSYGHEL